MADSFLFQNEKEQLFETFGWLMLVNMFCYHISLKSRDYHPISILNHKQDVFLSSPVHCLILSINVPGMH